MYFPPWAFYTMKEWDKVNIFYLDSDLRTAASYHCDKHVVKMILETTQVLSAVYHRYGADAPYKETHKNHPSTKWAGDSSANYVWLHLLGIALCREYTKRYGKIHKCEQYLNNELRDPPPGIPHVEFCAPPQCMPDEYKVEGDTVAAYRNYYRGAKSSIAKWKYSDAPQFMSVTDEI